ncbi:MAG: ligase-associated DNA damage response DEXH box helicase [Planctomycetes bacterium]|nr:ligase-associated DNA damage response DEXH box helicase [Planctomycetota bacterium]
MDRWFASQGWNAFEFQRDAWRAYLAGRSGLVHASTGTGKSYSVWLGVVEEGLREREAQVRGDAEPLTPGPSPARGEGRRSRKSNERVADPLRLLWITPMRALANDLVVNLERPIKELGLNWSVGLRTGDASAAERRRQKARMPTALVTTPESLSLLLSYGDARERFQSLRCVVVDEWHELIGNKRGVQTELGLARLRQYVPNLRTWGLSATLGNLEEARDVLLGNMSGAGVLIHGTAPKATTVETLLPPTMERFPWAGHLGKRMLPQVVEAIDKAQSTLVFTNTRSQAEIWFREILHARPKWAAEIALHHGSLDRGLREYVEGRTRGGTIKCVVCTSSLDLGVDFSPVDQVIQIGSPKGIARLLQRAGRSGHRPGAVSKILCVPTHAFELVEYAAAREAAAARRLEGRQPLDNPLDVLAQHVVTMALGEGVDADALYHEVRTTRAFRDLTPEQWRWTLDFVERGGPALRAYPMYSKLVQDGGRHVIRSPQTARLHRMTIGTITSDAAVAVQYLKGPRLGTIEESFIARLKPGDVFLFAGKTLEFVRFRDLKAYVRKATKPSGTVPRWEGGRLPLSTELASGVRAKLGEVAAGRFDTPETQRARAILEIQANWSRVPRSGELLIEMAHVQRGYQAFVYPFEGVLVNEGLATLVAHRLSLKMPRSLTITSNDYGFELLSPQPFDLSPEMWRELLTTDGLVEDLAACVNGTEMARRRFRDIARVAGLIFTGYPGAPTAARQLQASSGLIFDVFREYDPENLLVDQARREVLEQQLETRRMSAALRRATTAEIVVQPISRLTPLAFPLWAARIQKNQVSSEQWTKRVERMAVQLERAAERDEKKTRRGKTSQNADPSPPAPLPQGERGEVVSSNATERSDAAI